ncbi:GNAT family N-acetyltransferase [Paenibacillus lautus]|uniref:GNAT family N-acetyltransferase n=1 Tax=Paenibacillus TaxID=44249 RepID=UPI0004B7CC4B|nr:MULTISPECIES: GNAT family N-acetyltransferase [unclassified Paenibacillus]QOT09239.1 GNAT family N-acetyltransferase [Paenibacillus sp. JNUCC-32]WFB58765.1 GNAT family N-acetyltransferase [Paenibacillus sp. BR1-192]
MNSYHIRVAGREDAPFLREMLYESLYVPEGGEPFSRDILEEPFMKKYVEDWGRAGDLGYIAVNAAGKPSGSITIRYFDEGNKGFGYVSDDIPELGMALIPESRGQGLGTALMKELFRGMKERGIQKVSLSVAPDNAAAMKLYERFGFQEAGMCGTSITMVADVI